MKKVFLMAAIIAVSGVINESPAQIGTELITDSGNKHNDFHHRPHKSPKVNQTPQVSYNSASTVLNVSFSANSQGGKVEIYRNGVKVVNTTAPADASLSYVLRNYGKGDYTFIVSQGNTVVYSNNVVVK